MPNILKREKQAQIAKCLSEGNGIRTTSRIVGCSKNTVNSLQLKLGEACGDYQDALFQDLPCRVFSADEIWSFCQKKAKTARRKGEENTPDHGDIWTHTALCVDTKLVPCWFVGRRDEAAAHAFLSDLASRVNHKIQLTTDGHEPYIEAVERIWGMDVDYLVLEKIYSSTTETRVAYNPARVVATRTRIVQGTPDRSKGGTSYSESHNQKIRQKMRRFTRLTNGHSKKSVHHVAAVSFHMFVHNLITPHETLTRAQGSNCTPAMAAGRATTPYAFEQLVDLIR
ncbi:MAG: IS1 family transposase [bacterium]|nr:IS1 family transposase [bacterium]